MLWDRSRRINRGMNDFAHFEVRFMICEKKFPMLEALWRNYQIINLQERIWVPILVVLCPSGLEGHGSGALRNNQ